MLTNLPPVILASKSPRRQELLTQMGIDFRVVLKDVDESFPEDLSPAEIAVFISEKKAKAFDESLNGEIVITADTIVTIDGEILGKPEEPQEAFDMLSLLAAKKHEVITGVSLLKDHQLYSFYDLTEVWFKPLSPDEIQFYIENYKPFDKAGAYGIQEWIGFIGIEKMVGSYTNVVGLPTQKLYVELSKLTIK